MKLYYQGQEFRAFAFTVSEACQIELLPSEDGPAPDSIHNRADAA